MIKVLKEFFRILFLAILIGVCVGIFEMVVKYIVDASKFFFENTNVLFQIGGIVISFILGIMSYLLVQNNPEISGGGLGSLQYRIERKPKNVRPIKSVILLSVRSCFSFFSRLALGSEAPSVSIASYQSSIVNKVFKNEQKDDIAIAAGAGFGCAFLSPLAGVLFSFEIFIHKYTLKSFLRALFISLISVSICYIFYKNTAFSFVTLYEWKFSQYYILIMICVFCIIAHIIFNALLKFDSKFVFKHRNNFIIKYRVVFTFVIFAIIAAFYFTITGNGITSIKNKTGICVQLVILFLFIRMIMTSISLNSTATGGSVVPVMIIGGLVGEIIYHISSLCFGLAEEYEDNVIIVSALTFFAIHTRTVFTSFIFVMTEAVKTLNIEIIASFILPAFLAIFISVFIFKFLLNKISFKITKRKLG